MKNRRSYHLLRIGGQLLALIILHLGLNGLLPIIATSLLEGMQQWSIAAMLFTWLIQYAFIYVTIELRETLVKWSGQWIQQLPKVYVRRVLLLFNLLVFYIFFKAGWLLITIPEKFSVPIVVETILLLIQVWAGCGVAAPMSAGRWYKYFFRIPINEKSDWMKR